MNSPIPNQSLARKVDDERAESDAVTRFTSFLSQLVDGDAAFYWRWGDGRGGWFLSRLQEAIAEAGLEWPTDQISAPKPKKAKISRALARRVMERDLYRCVVCQTHLDLSCDHIVPESKGGPTTCENLQTMCRPCNSKKGAKLEALG